MDLPINELLEFAAQHAPQIVAPAAEQTKEQKPKKRVCIGIMAYDSKGYWRTFMSLMQAIPKCAELGWDVTYSLREGDSMVARGRSLLASKFVIDKALEDCTDLLLIDADIYWDGDEFCKILSHNVDVVGGAYPYKNDRGNFPLRWKPEGLWEENGLWIVDAVTPGFLRISRKALISIISSKPYLEVNDQKDGGKMWMFFDNLARPNGVYDEGYVFSEHWRSCGGTVYLDPDLNFTHIGTKAYNHGTIRAWMERKKQEVATLQSEFKHIPPLRLFNFTDGIGTRDELIKEEAEASTGGYPAYVIDMGEEAKPQGIEGANPPSPIASMVDALEAGASA